VPESVQTDRTHERFIVLTVGPDHDRTTVPHGGGHVRCGRLGDVHPTVAPPPFTGATHSVDHHGNELGRTIANDAAHVEGVAHLAVERVLDRRREPVRIGPAVGDDPGTARTVEADGNSRLSGDRTELGHGRAGPAGDCERQARIGEQRPAGGVRGRRHEPDRAGRQTGAGQRGIECVLDDRLRGTECIRADPEHHRIARTDDAGGVGEDVGSALEDESDDTERGPPSLDGPAVVTDLALDGISADRRRRPSSQTVDHVGTHRRRQDESGRRPVLRRCPGDIGVVGSGDRSERLVGCEPICEHLEEGGDLLVRATGQAGERVAGLLDRCCGESVLDRADVQEVALDGIDDQAVTSDERLGEFDGHVRHPVSREDDRLPRHQRRQEIVGHGFEAYASGMAEPNDDRFYFRQLLSGRDFAVGDQMATQMVNFVYAIGDRQTGDCVLVDPAYDPDGLVDAVEADGLTVTGVLATHYHADHIGGSIMGHEITGITGLLDRVSVPIHVQRDEIPWVLRSSGVSDDHLVGHDSGDIVEVGDVEIQLVHTPGHTPGSQCFLVGGKLVSGDTLFLDGCGRTDLPGSDASQMVESLNRLAKVDDEIVLYPGHRYSIASSATMGSVKQSNYIFDQILGT